MFVDGLQKQEMGMSSVLMIGQSNMAGRGNMEDVPPIRDRRCFMLRNGRWQPMRDPINPDRPIFEGQFRSGVSLAGSFARDYAVHFDAPVGLIPCADGGTSLDQWMPGEILYDHAVCLTRLAQRTSQLKAIIWHQGESDCRDGLVETYKERFVAMITQLRKDLGAEDVPVIIGELHTGYQERYHLGDLPVRMNQVFHQIARQLPFCAVASAEGLQLKGDGLHFDAVSSREFGSRYFQKYLEIKKDPIG